MDLLLDEKTHDMIFINGACPVTESAKPTVSQLLRINLQTFLGEWFLDSSVGIPYHQRVFGKHTNTRAVDLIFQTKIIETPGVIELKSFHSTLNHSTREYGVTFVVRTAEGLTDPITINV